MSKSHQTDKDKMFLDYSNSLNVSYEIIEKGSSLKLCALADNKLIYIQDLDPLQNGI
jgi:3'-phosphoadenosine 5'-phosphosulfate (PAPS) 3'-phosphatase